MAERPTWDQTFFRLALEMARRGTCPKLQTGCVIATLDMQVLVTGYNGAPRSMPHCTDEGCLEINGHCIRSIHAEQNAVCQAAYVGTSLVGTKAYCTHEPCPICTKLLFQAGVADILYLIPYGKSEEQAAIQQMFRAGWGTIEQYRGEL